MPTFVIHAMGRPPQKATIDKTEIVAGRDVNSDLILPAASVSHQHAVFSFDESKGWTVRCTSETNPIVVNGTLIKESAAVTEGTEVLVGTEFMLVFVENEFKVDQYMGGKSVFAKYECQKCHWTGMISAVQRTPACPSCGSHEVKSLEVYDPSVAQRETQEGATFAVDPKVVRASQLKIKSAKRSRLERIDGRTEGTLKKDLSETEATILGKKMGSTFKLYGFLVMGEGITIRWDGVLYVAESALLFPAMKVNGVKTGKAALHSGDVIEVGRNRFRLVTE